MSRSLPLLSGAAALVLAAALTVAGPHPGAEALGRSTGIGWLAQISVSTPSGDPATLRDGRPGMNQEELGGALSLPARPGEWVQFDWVFAQRVTSVQVYGASTGARITAGVLTFSNGTSLDVGEVLRDSAFPTVLAFPAQSVNWVRFTTTSVVGTGSINLAEFRVYPSGDTPLRFGRTDPATVAQDPENPACTARSSMTSPGSIAVLCPTPTSTVRGPQTITVQASGLTRIGITAWAAEPGSQPLPEVVAPVASGRASVRLELQQLPAGPMTVALRGVAGPSLRASTPTYLQLYNVGLPPWELMPISPGANGRTLAYTENFDRPISLSRDGRSPTADYAAAKPEPGGVSEFGAAIFADPSRGFDNLRTADGRYLRIAVRPNPPGYADPGGYGRRHIGGLVASARPGGSGFSARHGYFEARILAPASPGTWPAFWLMPTDNLIQARPTVAEIDIMELYGHDPLGACHTTHSYAGGRDTAGVSRCGRRFASPSDALRWHVYGVSVEPTEVVYWIDGQVVARAPQVPGGDKPMFFMLDLALGGGWPVKLDSVQNRAAMYVDWVRVYV